jgi:syntaxin 1B/2/3
MSVLVEQQDETINTIEATAGVIEKDTEAGYATFPILHSTNI